MISGNGAVSGNDRIKTLAVLGDSLTDRLVTGIPDRCRDVANAHNLSPYDIEVFNVHYTDCNDAWIMCRHHKAEVSQDQMIEVFGRLPVKMRSWVRTTIGNKRARLS